MPSTDKNRKKAEVANRRKLVAANLLAGANYRDMAESTNVSLGTIANDVKIILKEWRTATVTDTEEWVAVELRKLDVMGNAIWDKAKGGDGAAIDRMLRLMERRAAYKGLDAPKVLSHTGKAGGAIELAFTEMVVEMPPDEPAAPAGEQDEESPTAP